MRTAAGDALFAFTRLPPSQWKSARTTNAIERLHEEFKRRIKTQTVLPSAETAAISPLLESKEARKSRPQPSRNPSRVKFTRRWYEPVFSW